MNPLRTIDVAEAITNQNDLALILSKHLFSSTKAKHSNTVFSPASITAALTLAASGPPLSDGSRVTDEILSFLRSSSTDELNAVFREIVSVVFSDHSSNGGPKITSVNGVWIEQTLRVDSSFKDLFENDFKARFGRVDFRSKAEEVRRELNKWAQDHTNGLIKDLLPPGSVSEITDCVYGNALYFKGAWEVPFDKFYTRDEEFHLLNGTSVSVPFMSSRKSQYIQAYDGFKVLRLPYRQGGDGTNPSLPFGQGCSAANGGLPFGQGGFFPFGQETADATNRGLPFGQEAADATNHHISMYFYLPEKKDGLDDLVKTMASTSGFLDSHVPRFKVDVDQFRIPKFKIDYRLKGQDLEFCSKVPLYHKACVEIDEEGAEAAAATFVICIPGSLMRKKTDFVADHPFLFVIREDKTGTLLFVGQIFNPSQKSSI